MFMQSIRSREEHFLLRWLSGYHAFPGLAIFKWNEANRCFGFLFDLLLRFGRPIPMRPNKSAFMFNHIFEFFIILNLMRHGFPAILCFLEEFILNVIQ